MPRSPFNLERHDADYKKYGWHHKENCICRGNFVIATPSKPRDPSAPELDDSLPAGKRMGDGTKLN